ncbi:MAG: hypothetical protein A2V70_17805 [Planctomycetes bacterium RBG_13_63_9]|nr:MAG: hypothetical protein A2V70_17805 [Planctomycetes bacterium RBG_13_63_9]
MGDASRALHWTFAEWQSKGTLINGCVLRESTCRTKEHYWPEDGGTARGVTDLHHRGYLHCPVVFDILMTTWCIQTNEPKGDRS